MKNEYCSLYLFIINTTQKNGSLVTYSEPSLIKTTLFAVSTFVILLIITSHFDACPVRPYFIQNFDPSETEYFLQANSSPQSARDRPIPFLYATNDFPAYGLRKYQMVKLHVKRKCSGNAYIYS